jgi:putative membrane protein
VCSHTVPGISPAFQIRRHLSLLLTAAHPSRYIRATDLCWAFGLQVLNKLQRITEGLIEQKKEIRMRYFYIGLVVVVTAVVLLFKIQNLSAVTVSLFSLSLTLPASLLVVGIYFLGMLTGSALLSFLRSSIRGATRKPD